MDDIEFFNKRFDKTLIDRLEQLTKKDFKVLTYTKAIELLKKAKVKFEFPVDWGVDLSSEHEKYVVDHYKLPCVITN